MDRRTLSVLVDNTSGVLTRISGLFSRRGYNIESLAVGQTHEPSVSRMTIVVYCDEKTLDQVVQQLKKQLCVKTVEVLDDLNSTRRELLLLKVAATPKTRSGIIEIANIFRARIIDVSKESITLEITGEGDKSSAIISVLSEYKILEIARTGIIALERGGSSIYEKI